MMVGKKRARLSDVVEHEVEGKKRVRLGNGVEHHQTGADWSAMPLDLLRTIAGFIDELPDYSRFGAVCKSWNSATFSSYDDCPTSSKRRLEYPWLMLAPSTTTGDTRRGFYSLHTGKEFYLDLPEIHNKVCIGTPCGRLLTIDADENMHLFNPLTRQHLPLPKLTTTSRRHPYPILCTETFERYTKDALPLYDAVMFVYRALVVWDDDTPIVFVNYWNSKLAMARAGDTSWTPVECYNFYVIGIELFRGQVLAVTGEGGKDPTYDHSIHMVDLSLSPPSLKEFASSPCQYYATSPLYLVDLGGDLHALACDCDFRGSKNHWLKRTFSVYKFNMVGKSWEKVHTLGGWTAFVGRNSSFAIPSATNYPMCRPNCIYFTDDFSKEFYRSGGNDWGIFSVEGKGKKECDRVYSEEKDLSAMSRYPFPSSSKNQFSQYCPPLWLAPSLW